MVARLVFLINAKGENRKGGGGVWLRGGGLIYPFLKIGKKCPDFAKTCTDCVHVEINVLILSAVLEASSWKIFKNFSLWDLSFVCCRCNIYMSHSKKLSLP